MVEPFGAVMNGSADSYQFATHDFDAEMNLVNANGRIYALPASSRLIGWKQYLCGVAAEHLHCTPSPNHFPPLVVTREPPPLTSEDLGRISELSVSESGVCFVTAERGRECLEAHFD